MPETIDTQRGLLRYSRYKTPRNDILLIPRPQIIEALNGAGVITQHHDEPDGQRSPCSSSFLESLIMNRSHLLSAAILALFGACAQAATDPVALSFERMLNHTPITWPIAPPQRPRQCPPTLAPTR